MRARSTFVCLFISLGLIGVSLFFIRFLRFQPSAAPSMVTSRSVSEIHQDWMTSVTQILQAFDKDGQAAKARDALLELTVAGSDRQMHLELVLAFESFIQHPSASNARLKRARLAFSSLSSP